MRKPRRGRKHIDKYFCQNCLDQNWLIECECGCHELIFRYDNHRRLRRFKNNHNPKGLNCRLYKNGRFRYVDNYYGIRVPGYFSSDTQGRVLEHIYVYQEYHKCCMLPWGHVHHKEPVTEDYCNNMPWNLEGIMGSRHITYHNTTTRVYKKKNRDNIRCSLCGSHKTYTNPDGYVCWYGNRIDGWKCKNCYNLRYRKNKDS